MTVARATVLYCILCGRRKRSAAVFCYDSAAQTKTDAAAQTKQNIAEAITHKLNKHNK